MIYNYSPLFDTLRQKGLTRKQLREALQLSPATMARMSAGEPIATETLGRICDLLQCSLDKIFTIRPEKELPGRWASIDNALTDGKPATFRIYMYFLLPADHNEPAVYLYGYAKPYIVEEAGMEKWQVSCYADEGAEFCSIAGTLHANNLRRFLDAAINRFTLEDISKFLGFEYIPDSSISKNKYKTEYLSSLLKIRVANGNFVYRPPYLLLPQNASLEHTAELMPLLSYEEETTICESLHGTNKKSYYCTKTGIDTTKAQLIWAYLSKMLPFHNNLNEMARLGNFEVLTYPKGTLHQAARCEIWRDNNVQKGAKITISNQLSGKYILRVKLQNGRNPILDNSYVINPQDEEENPIFIPLNEDFFFAELELWTAFSADNTESRLIYHSCTPYVRQISVTMNVLERNLILEDRWSQAMKKRGKKVHTNVTFFSTQPDSPSVGLPEEPWLTEEKKIQHDYHILFGEGKKLHEHDAFFPKGIDKTIAFLAWLNERLKSLPKTKRVLLFDPYINDTSIVNFIRNISNIKVTYEIITDSYPAGNRAKRETEIRDIKNLSLTLGNVISVCNLTVRTFTKKSGSLHDRILMIVDTEQVIVYVLSNSLDSVAKDHSTIVTAVKPAVAQAIFADYVQLISEAEVNANIELIFNIKNPALCVVTPINTTPEPIENADGRSAAANGNATNSLPSTHVNNTEITYTKNDFIQDYSGPAIETALGKLAYMTYDDKLSCVNYVLSLDKTTEIERLQTLLLKAKNIPAPLINQGLGSTIHSLNQMTIQEFDLAGNLVEYAADAIGWSFRFRPATAYAFNYAIKILWSISPNHYTAFLEKLIEEYTVNNQQAAKISLTPEALLMYTMIAHIIKSISSENETERDLQILAKSRIAFFKAIYAAKCTWLSEKFIHNLILGKEDKTEFLSSEITIKCKRICASFTTTETCAILIFLIKRLQIEICRNKSIQQRIQSLIKIITTFYVQTLAKNKKSDTSSLIQQLAPLYMRNPADICQIISNLNQIKYLTNEQSYEVLIHFWKLTFTNEKGKDKEFYDEETIQKCLIIVNHILKIGNNTAGKLQKEIEKRSRILCTRLYDPLLYAKNYTVWKIAVEQLSCLFITEHYIVKNVKNMTMGKGEGEYKIIMENYEETLSQYSAVYKIWKAESEGGLS